jgi:hypothetical protein
MVSPTDCNQKLLKKTTGCTLEAEFAERIATDPVLAKLVVPMACQHVGSAKSPLDPPP